MVRSVRNRIFHSEAPPAVAVISLLMFVAAMILFWHWMAFVAAHHLRATTGPCAKDLTVIPYRSKSYCATMSQAHAWARLRLAWLALFAGSFLAAFAGRTFRKWRC